MLRPDDDLTVRRAAERAESPLPDYPRNMLRAFADLGEFEAHVIDNTRLNPSETAAEIRRRFRRRELLLQTA